DDVDPVGAARLHPRLELELRYRGTHVVRDTDAERKGVGLIRRVEIEQDEVGTVRLVDARGPRIHVDAVLLHRPLSRRALVHEHEVDEPGLSLRASRMRDELPSRDPRWHPPGRLLLKERLTGDAVRPALQRERPVAEMWDERVGDLAVVLEQ